MKISQGKYELFTTKEDAIDKFMQLQGVCREEINGENPIMFYCTKKGEILITNPPTRHVENDNSTNLFAEIIEENGKTYVTYYTSFDKSNNVLNMIFIVIYLLLAVFAIVVTIMDKDKAYYLAIFGLALPFFGVKLFASTKEEENSPKDSEILIKELKNRIEAVNLWDK